MTNAARTSLSGSGMPAQPAAPAFRRTKIVATLGPATDGHERDLVVRGVDVARLNFSHGVPEEHARRCRAIRQAASDLGRWVAVLQDLPGPKIRVGRLQGGQPITLVAGQELVIAAGEVEGTSDRISSTYPGLSGDLNPGDALLLDDGRLRLRVISLSGGDVRASVEVGGLLGEHKGINLPGIAVSLPALTEVDREYLRFGLTELNVDYVALSFVRRAAEVGEARQVIDRWRPGTPLIVKLEKREAIEDLSAIVSCADALMVARGDLGVELGPENVPAAQKVIVEQANARGIPVITATQMLESMTQAEIPTRAEASDVANAVWDGSDAVMLSGETAVGRHPALVVETMDRVVRSAESAQHFAAVSRYAPGGHGGEAAAVTHAARILAQDLQASAIVAATPTGRTAQILSSGRPATPVYAFSPDESVCRRLALWWGVTPVLHAAARTLEANIAAMEGYLLAQAGARAGDLIVVVGAHPFRPGVHTNFVEYRRLRQTG